VVQILRDGDRRIRSLPPGDHHLRYDYLRATMAKIARVDAFYVGFYRDDDNIAYPYAYDLDVYDTPSVATYGPYGVGAWLLQHKKTYTYAMDQGRMLNSGHRFGDTTRSCRDVVTVPLLDDSTGVTTVLGMASMQSYTPNVYDEQTVHAFEWLCRTIVALIRREHEDAQNQRNLDFLPAEGEGVGPTFADVVVDFTDRLAAVRTALGRVREAALAGGDVIGGIDEVDRLCMRAQQETFAVLTRPSADAMEPLSLLTAREREIADLIGARMSNQQIAETLTISLPTVKSHVYNIMRKFEVKQRSEIAAKLRPFGYSDLV
jgi:DNA-binding CsgD family transcriptional regulator